MFAQAQFVYRVPTPRFRVQCKTSASTRYLSDQNSKPIREVHTNNTLHVLAFERNGQEGIYSITEHVDYGEDIDYIIAFRTFDEAFRYKTLLEADTDYKPYIEFMSLYELNHTCNVGKYECRVVNPGTLVIPPIKTRQVTDWEMEMDKDL